MIKSSYAASIPGSEICMLQKVRPSFGEARSMREPNPQQTLEKNR
jgi:hypothetical protein